MLWGHQWTMINGLSHSVCLDSWNVTKLPLTQRFLATTMFSKTETMPTAMLEVRQLSPKAAVSYLIYILDIHQCCCIIAAFVTPLNQWRQLEQISSIKSEWILIINPFDPFLPARPSFRGIPPLKNLPVWECENISSHCCPCLKDPRAVSSSP